MAKKSWVVINGRRPFNGWLYEGKHDALIEQVMGYPGDRSELLIRALETFFELPPEQRQDPSERLLAEIVQMRTAIQNLPSRIVSQISTHISGLIRRNRNDIADDTDEFDTRPVATNEDLMRRRENRAANPW